eukprot:snap_masked-scaffold_2-processed-gene-27.42-mRNA-1 protein AED:0.20 eAED:0.20 QI:0/-1/0/1/-1/1/1/0/335
MNLEEVIAASSCFKRRVDEFETEDVELRENVKRPRLSESDVEEDCYITKSLLFTVKQDLTLKKFAQVYNHDWAKVAAEVGRSATECERRWKMKYSKKRGCWSEKEDRLLTRLVREIDAKNWGDIALNVEGRSAKQCRERWCFILDPSIKKSEWTAEEDQILLSMQEQEGNKWAKIATLIPGRTENSVKTRFKSLERLKKRSWTEEEDQKLVMLQQTFGCRWDKISEYMEKRTKNAARLRFKYLKCNPSLMQKHLDSVMAPREDNYEIREQCLDQEENQFPLASTFGDIQVLVSLVQEREKERQNINLMNEITHQANSLSELNQQLLLGLLQQMNG